MRQSESLLRRFADGFAQLGNQLAFPCFLSRDRREPHAFARIGGNLVKMINSRETIMNRTLYAAIGLTTALFLIPSTHAKVVSQSAAGFVVTHEADVAVDPKAAYDAFVKVGRWWNDSHSFSGAAKNISIEPRADGCWCEALPNGGSVRHMTVVHANPGALLVFNGGLGPLQFMGVAGSMKVSFKARDKGTHVSVVYAVGGYDAGDFKDISQGVDAVLGEQIKRYGDFASTGKP
jgi:hypothetical protein